MRKRTDNSRKEKPVCPKCEGTRMVCIETKKATCSTCKGKGKDLELSWKLCADCRGSGKVDAEYYSRCRQCIDD